jgi:hypothetical protein
MRANASLDHVKHLQAKRLHNKQVACSREQRSSDMTTTDMASWWESATTVRYWTEDGGSKKLIKSPSLANDVEIGPNSRPSASQIGSCASDSYHVVHDDDENLNHTPSAHHNQFR